MALQKTITMRVVNKEITFDDAYIKITNVIGNKEKLNCVVTVLTKANGEVIKNFEFNFIPNQSENSLRWDKQAYEYLKSTDEFANAIDV